MEDELKQNNETFKEKSNQKESFETLFKLEQRLHEVKEKLQIFSRRRRNEAIIVTFGLVSVVTAILTVVGSDAIKNNVDNIIGKSAKLEIEESIKSLNIAKNEFKESLKELEIHRKHLLNYNKWDKVNIDMDIQYFLDVKNALNFTKSPIGRIHYEGTIVTKLSNKYINKIKLFKYYNYYDFKLFNLLTGTEPNYEGFIKEIETNITLIYRGKNKLIESNNQKINVVFKRMSEHEDWIAYLRVYNSYSLDELESIMIDFEDISYQSKIR